MRKLFNAIQPFVTHTLPVSDGHRLYIEECGRKDGLPVAFVHGGPGAGCELWHRQFFDPQIWRIILFDQRGCGRSTPHAELTGNDTASLVADMEAIRDLADAGDLAVVEDCALALGARRDGRKWAAPRPGRSPGRGPDFAHVAS